MENTIWFLIGAIIAAVTATIALIALLAQLKAASNERMEAIYESLMHDLNMVVLEMKGWDGEPTSLSDNKKRVIARMLHMHLDSLVETIAVEGRCGRCCKFFYRLGVFCRLGVGRSSHVELAGKWLLLNYRYKRFENWYSDTLRLYHRLNSSRYVEEVFHIEIKDPHKDIPYENSLQKYFNKRELKIG
jgi:metal-responsive CopG/Arc/MetJ family transcriptional regulator